MIKRKLIGQNAGCKNKLKVVPLEIVYFHIVVIILCMYVSYYTTYNCMSLKQEDSQDILIRNIFGWKNKHLIRLYNDMLKYEG